MRRTQVPSLTASLLLAALAAFPASAAPKARTVEYTQDTVTLQGVLVADPAGGKAGAGGKVGRPGILLFSDWMGVSDEARSKAESIARLGYVVLVADIYGKGKNPKDQKEAGALAGIYKSDRALMRQRAEAGLRQLLAEPGVDTTRLAAMGYCFGGTVALELARTGAPLDGVVSVHGNLDTPDPAMAKNIKGRVLVLHGADDPFVPPEQVRNFQDEMRGAGADWSMVYYGGAVHSFTNPKAGNDPSKGAAYNAAADARASEALKGFYADVFGAKAVRK